MSQTDILQYRQLFMRFWLELKVQYQFITTKALSLIFVFNHINLFLDEIM